MPGIEPSTEVLDAELVRQAQQSPAAFKTLVDRYSGRLYAFLRRSYFFEHEDLQDVLQDTFLRLYRNLNAFDPSFAFSTWAYQIARHTAIDALRKKQTRPQAFALEQDEWDRIASSAHEVLGQDLHLEEVKRAIEELPLPYREAFTLFYLEERTYEEMIDILKKPKGTIASLLSRAKKLLQERLAHHAPIV